MNDGTSLGKMKKLLLKMAEGHNNKSSNQCNQSNKIILAFSFFQGVNIMDIFESWKFWIVLDNINRKTQIKISKCEAD